MIVTGAATGAAAGAATGAAAGAATGAAAGAATGAAAGVVTGAAAGAGTEGVTIGGVRGARIKELVERGTRGTETSRGTRDEFMFMGYYISPDVMLCFVHLGPFFRLRPFVSCGPQ
jgi:hypothetical protein